MSRSRPKDTTEGYPHDLVKLAEERGGKVLSCSPPPSSPKRSKYGAVRTTYNGVVFHSKAEAARAKALDAMKASGLVVEWVPQPVFRLGCPENVYKADFLVVGAGGVVWVEDTKGAETAKFKKDKRLWRAYGRLPLYVLKGEKSEVITPIGEGERK